MSQLVGFACAICKQWISAVLGAAWCGWIQLLRGMVKLVRAARGRRPLKC
jgi:hypothetical protein